MANVAIPTNAVDLEGLGDLRRRAHREDPNALADVAVQFEALFIGMMLDSARSAALGNGIFDGQETEQYLALMDRQVALELARNGGFGFGKTLLEQLGPRETEVPATEMVSRRVSPQIATPSAETAAEFPTRLPASLAAVGGDVERSDAPTPAEFVTSLLPEAKAAAESLGVDPRLLVAQAALETGWGRALPRDGSESSNNLFGIKASASWSGATVEQWTLEHADGVTAPQRAEFRAYAGTDESFADYAKLIGTSRRYEEALGAAHDPEAYARAVTKAGYATDPAYADKWLAIYHGDRLDHALRGLDLPSPGAVTTK
jgi:flagellar protein FlgJ